MLILSIETSCDETAISIVEAVGDFPHAKYEILGNALFSQIETHREYGGVFPALAKREHIATILPMLEKALKESGLTTVFTPTLTSDDTNYVHELLNREDGLADQIINFHQVYGRPPIDIIAVTTGPGLEPALCGSG
jgi:tRNA A37 threonylcarbamoyltransferase TsaD